MKTSLDISKIMVTTDFSDYSKYAFKYALTIAEKFSASITVLHVIQPTITPADYAWVAPASEATLNRKKYCKHTLKSIAQELIPKEIENETVVVHGSPFREIITYSRENNIDLIVMATHGLGGLSHVLFGSTTEKVVRKSFCPVLTVRDPKHKFEMP